MARSIQANEAEARSRIWPRRIRVLRRHAVVVLYQTAADAHKQQSGWRRQAPEKRRDNFFRFVAQLTQCRVGRGRCSR